jgi:WD40 repeat protein
MSSRLAERVTPLFRGTVAPSTVSYLPTYQERSSSKPIQPIEERDTDREADVAEASGVDLALFSLLEPVFRANKGSLDLDQFVSAVVDRAGDQNVDTRPVVASAAKLFRGIDFLDEGSVTWDAFSHHLITRKLNESNLNVALNAHADLMVSRVESIGANSGGVARIRELPEIQKFAVMGVNTRALHLFSDEDASELTLQSPDRCVVNDVCLVHETGQLAILGADQTVLLYDLAPIVLLRSRVVLAENHFALVAVGNRIFAGSVQGNITEMYNGEVTVHKKCHGAEIYSLVYLPALSSIGSASADGRVLLWDLKAGNACFENPSVSLRGHKQAALYIAFNVRHTLLITGGLDKDALVWNPYVEREPVSRLQGHCHALCGVGTRQSQIVTVDVSGVLRIWDANTFRPLFSLSLGTSLSSLAVSTHGIWCGSDSGKVFCITSNSKSSSLKCLHVAVSKHTQRVFTVTQSSVYVYTFDGSLRKRFPLRGLSSPVTSLALTGNGRAYITGHTDGSVIMFSAATGEYFSLIGAFPESGEISVILSQSCKVIVGTSTGLIRVLQVHKGKAEVRVEYRRHTDSVVSLLLTPDEHLILSAGHDGTLALFNLKELRQGLTLKPTEEPLIGLATDNDLNIRVCDKQGTIVKYSILQEAHLMEVSRRTACSDYQTAQCFGLVSGEEYVCTIHNQILTSVGEEQTFPAVCRRIFPFRDEYIMLHMQDGHVIITDKQFKDIMYLGNALPLEKPGKSDEDREIELLGNKCISNKKYSDDKPITPFALPSSKFPLTRKQAKPSSLATFERLATSRLRAETIFRSTKLPDDISKASEMVAIALFESGMDELKLFDCNPRP